MSLRKRGSRSICVAGEQYRWTVSRSIQAETGKIAVVIEAIRYLGRRLVVRVPCRDFWLDLSDHSEAPSLGFLDAYRPVTPATVQKIISAALAAGWTPARQQPKPRTYEWTDGGVLIPQTGRAEARLIRKRG